MPPELPAFEGKSRNGIQGHVRHVTHTSWHKTGLGSVVFLQWFKLISGSLFFNLSCLITWNWFACLQFFHCRSVFEKALLWLNMAPVIKSAECSNTDLIWTQKISLDFVSWLLLFFCDISLSSHVCFVCFGTRACCMQRDCWTFDSCESYGCFLFFRVRGFGQLTETMTSFLFLGSAGKQLS